MIDEVPARYRDACGNPMHGVTTILKAGGYIDTSFLTEDGRDRGTLLHRTLQRLDEGRDVNCHPDIAGRVDAYQRFVGELRPTYTAIERTFISDVLHYAGTVDRIGTLFGQPAILDFKGGAPQTWHGYQLWAYWFLAGADPQMLRYGLYLKENARYQLRPYDDPHDAHKFLDALRRAS